MSDQIHVAVRIRPLISREAESKASVLWKADRKSISQINSPSTQFQFDRVFDATESNESLYAEFCSPLVKSVIDGFNGTIFAYGQTSSGKTYTISGSGDGKKLGIIHHAISDLFNFIQEKPEREFLLRVSYMEVYNETVVDLLSNNENLKLKTDKYGNIKVDRLSEHIVQEPEQVLQLMKRGEGKRKTGDTLMNEKSSRSHSIFQVIIESGLRNDEDSAVNVSQFNLVDLAGSERASQTGAKGARFKESININKSLMTLGQVIKQLSERTVPDQFINYRDSKLTRILQNSLGGNARTAIICTITPACLDETVSTLKFATRAKSVKNKPEVNEVVTEQALLKRYANEIKKLTKELEAAKEKAQQNENLQEQISTLRKQFVSQLPQEQSKRALRRETWGGCLDAARLQSFTMQRTASTSDLFSVDSSKPRRSLLFPNSNLMTLDEEDVAPSYARHSKLLSELPVVEEVCEFETNEVEDSIFSSKYSLDPRFDSPLSTDIVETTDVIVQTDIVLKVGASVQTDMHPIEIHASDPEKQKLQAELEHIRKELVELKEFTRWEKEITRLCSQTNSILDVEEPRHEKSRGILLIENLTPKRSNSRFSVGNENIITGENSPLTNFSSTPVPVYSALNSKSANKDTELCNSLLDLKPCELINVNLKFESETEHLSSDKEELFHYLENTTKILCKRMHINHLPKISKLNGPSKVIFDMFNLILEYQCLILSNCPDNLSANMKEISDCLNEILFQLNDKDISHETAEDMIDNFMNKMESTLKEMDMYSLGTNYAKRSFEDHVHAAQDFESAGITGSCSEAFDHLPKNEYIDQGVNRSTIESSVEGFSPDSNLQLKCRISELEQDVEQHLKTIASLMKKNDLKIQQILEKEKELQEQNEVIDNLKAELNGMSAKDYGNSILPNSCTLEESGTLNKSTETISVEFYNSVKCSEVSDGNFQLGKDSLLKDKLLDLETNLAMQEKVISDLKNEKDLKEKQIILFTDKVHIQEQIIDHLKEELALFNNGSKAEDSRQDANVSVTFTSSACQTSLLNEPDLVCSSDPNFDVELITSEADIQCDLIPRNSVSNEEITSILLDLKYVREYAFDYMMKNMEREYLGEINVPAETENCALSDQVKMEISSLKDMLSRIDFYIKMKAESYEYFYDKYEDSLLEVSSLKQEYSDSKQKLNEKEAEILNLEEAFFNLENEILVLVGKYEIPKHLDGTNYLSLNNGKMLNRICKLQEIINQIDYFLKEKSLMHKEAENKLADLQNKNLVSFKISRNIQTDEDAEFIKISKKLEESEIEREQVQIRITELNLVIEKLDKEKASLAHEMEAREMLYNTKIDHLKSEFEKEKSTWTEKAMKTYKDECDQMLIEQKNKFFEKISEIKQEQSKQMQEKLENQESEQEKISSMHKNRIAELEEDLKKSIDERYSERRELEEIIKNLKREAFFQEELKSKFKRKCKHYAEQLQKLKARPEKGVKESEVQTSITQLNLNELLKEKRSFQSVGTQSKDIKMQEILLMESDFCSDCIKTIQKRYYMSNKLHTDSNVLESNSCCKKLNMELETKKAKIISLTRNNDSLVKETVSLKKEVSRLSEYLRNCWCKTIPRPVEEHGHAKHEISEKRKELSNKNDQKDCKPSARKEIYFENEDQLLKSDLVLRAIESALEEQKGFLTGGSGPANMLANYMLKHKLNIAEKRRSAAEKELADLKAYTSTRRACRESEHRPPKGSDFGEKDYTVFTAGKHPYPLGAVPKAPAKNILKPSNDVFSTPASDIFQKDTGFATPAAFNLRSPELPDSQAQKVNDKENAKDIFDASEPNCKTQ